VDRRLAVHHLTEAARHVQDGERILARQRRFIEKLRESGQDSTAAELLLNRFKESQALHIATYARLRAELKGGAPKHSVEG
jgi:hypothetical protein